MSPSRPQPSLVITTAPFLREERDTPSIMLEVCAALVPVVVAAGWYFGISALLVIGTSTAAALATEWFFTRGRAGRSSLRDNSALLTGLLLGLTLPPGISLWMAALGGFIAITLGKSIWGGVGNNIFNPALVGRAFLQAAFPVPITTWVAPGQGFWHLYPGTLAMPLQKAPPDVVSTASPLGLAKFEHQTTELGRLLLGNTAGSIGETCALVLILCGVWLAWRRIFDWRLPVATLLAVAIMGGILHLLDPRHCPDPLFLLCSGGLLLGAVFMVTDPVTSPITLRGVWVFGCGVGVLVVLIRAYGGLPEGVMYAILLMNAVTPLINRATQPRVFGGGR